MDEQIPFVNFNLDEICSDVSRVFMNILVSIGEILNYKNSLK